MEFTVWSVQCRVLSVEYKVSSVECRVYSVVNPNKTVGHLSKNKIKPLQI